MKRLAITAVIMWVLAIVLCVFVFPFVLIRSCEKSIEKRDRDTERFENIVSATDENSKNFYFVSYDGSVECREKKVGNILSSAKKTIISYAEDVLDISQTEVKPRFRDALFAGNTAYFLCGASDISDGIAKEYGQFLIAADVQTASARIVAYYNESTWQYVASYEEETLLLGSKSEIALVNAEDGGALQTVGGDGWTFEGPFDGFLYYRSEGQGEGASTVFGFYRQEGTELTAYAAQKDYGELLQIINGAANFLTYYDEKIWVAVDTGEVMSEGETLARLRYEYIAGGVWRDTAADGFLLVDENASPVVQMDEKWISENIPEFQEIGSLSVFRGMKIKNVFGYGDKVYIIVHAYRQGGLMEGPLPFGFLCHYDVLSGKVTRLGVRSEFAYIYGRI